MPIKMIAIKGTYMECKRCGSKYTEAKGLELDEDTSLIFCTKCNKYTPWK